MEDNIVTVLDDEQYPVFEGSRLDVVAWLLARPHVETSHMLSIGRHTKHVSVPEYLERTAEAALMPFPQLRPARYML